MRRIGEKARPHSYNPERMVMGSRGLRRPFAAIAVTAAMALLASCGGSDSSSTSTPSTRGAAAAPTTGDRGTARPPAEHGSSTGEGPTGESDSKGAGPATSPEAGEGAPGDDSGTAASAEGRSLPRVSTPLKVSGGGSAQVRTRGGDNSIQDFGEESSESDLREAAEALHGYYVAQQNEEWDRACSLLSSDTARQLEEFASRGESGGGTSCADALGGTTMSGLPASVRRELTVVDAISLRREEDRGFLIYRGEYDGRSRLNAISMVLEDGAWKVGGLGALPLE